MCMAHLMATRESIPQGTWIAPEQGDETGVAHACEGPRKLADITKVRQASYINSLQMSSSCCLRYASTSLNVSTSSVAADDA